MKKYTGIKILLIATAIAAGAGIVYYVRQPQSTIVVSLFQEKRDLNNIHNLFKKDWYWLSERSYDVDVLDWMIKTGSPNEYEPEYFGKMKFKVLRDEGRFAGFVSYYMKNFHHGTVLYLAVEPELRSKGYGMILLKDAIHDLFALGAQKVTLAVRKNNIRGRQFYGRAGMAETPSDNENFIIMRIEK
jgi:ribosomal protein S18 acetylase RimI-like enzyme